VVPNSSRLALCAFLIVCSGAFMTCAAVPASSRQITLDELRDRIQGGWAGQMIGVSFGAPTEFTHLEATIDDALPVWRPENVRNALNQDDLYVDMTFAKVLDDKGLDATSDDFGVMFRDARYRLWHANLSARRALKRGVPGSSSGLPRYNAHANDIDFQIESDFIGLMAPGLPQATNELCYRAGRVMNFGDGIYGGMFVSAMYAAAFFERDPRRVVEAGLAALPPASPYAMTIADVLAWSRTAPADWRTVWKQIEAKWNKREPCPEGALTPFNIDAKLNGAYVALGLLYGGGDFAKTLDVSTRAGQDSDCNPSNAAGVLGVMLGYSRIPDVWKAGIPGIQDERFSYTDFSFRTIVESTMKRAIALVERHGGRLQGEILTVNTQQVIPAKLEVWDDYGTPVERVPIGNARWTRGGPWVDDRVTVTSHARVRGAFASIEFDGTGAVLVGTYLQTGGRADVFLDGFLDRTVDTYVEEVEPKTSETIWHHFGLKPGRHALRLVVRGEPFADSLDTMVTLKDLVVFR
jgi:ADP-ribosylglycohydrolase